MIGGSVAQGRREYVVVAERDKPRCELSLYFAIIIIIIIIIIIVIITIIIIERTTNQSIE